MIIGITGGTGCGKTTALSAILELGGKVLDCDAIYHDLLKNDKVLLGQIANAFPGVVENGILDRKKLGNIVFNDAQKLSALNSITHKRVKQAVLEKLNNKNELVAIDAVALFESGLADLCDMTVAIIAPEDQRLQRVMTRDGISCDYAKSRIAAQPSQEAFSQKCDYILENDTTKDAFHSKCIAFFKQIVIIKETQ